MVRVVSIRKSHVEEEEGEEWHYDDYDYCGIHLPIHSFILPFSPCCPASTVGIVSLTFSKFQLP